MVWSDILEAWEAFGSSMLQMVDDEKTHLAIAGIVLVSLATLLPGFRLKNIINEQPRRLTVQHFSVFPHAVSMCSFWAWTLACALSLTCGRLFIIFNACMASYELLLIVAFALFGTSEGDRDKALSWCLLTGGSLLLLDLTFFAFDGTGVTVVMEVLAASLGIFATFAPAISYLCPCNGWIGNPADNRLFVGGKADILLLFASPINAALWAVYASKTPMALALKLQASFGALFGLMQLFTTCLLS